MRYYLNISIHDKDVIDVIEQYVSMKIEANGIESAIMKMDLKILLQIIIFYKKLKFVIEIRPFRKAGLRLV